MLMTPQEGNQQGQCPSKKAITQNKGHHTAARLSPAPSPRPSWKDVQWPSGIRDRSKRCRSENAPWGGLRCLQSAVFT